MRCAILVKNLRQAAHGILSNYSLPVTPLPTPQMVRPCTSYSTLTHTRMFAALDYLTVLQPRSRERVHRHTQNSNKTRDVEQMTSANFLA